MATPAKITGGPSHRIDRVRKRRATGRIDASALGAGLGFDDQGRLTIVIGTDSTGTTIGGDLSDFILAASTKRASPKVYAWSAFK